MALLATAVSAAAQKNDDLECMFLGYPDLEYDGFDRTEVRFLDVSKSRSRLPFVMWKSARKCREIKPFLLKTMFYL